MRQGRAQFFLRLHGLWKDVAALPPPPEPPFDIGAMEPLEVSAHIIWRDDFEEFPPDRWTGRELVWTAPELDLFPRREWAFSGAN